MKYEEHALECIKFDEGEVLASWVVVSGTDGEVQSVNPGTSDK